VAREEAHTPRLLLASVVALAAGMAVSLAVGASAAPPVGRWVIQDLGTLGGPESDTTEINESGQIIGWADKVNGRGWQFRHAFLWQNGKMRDLGTLGGPGSRAYAINNRGQIVGEADTTSAKDKDGDAFHHAFLWQDGMLRDLGTFKGSPGSAAYDINDRGQVVGSADTTDVEHWLGGVSRIGRVFVWQSGRMRDLGTLGGPGSSPTGISNRGEIIGYADTARKDENGDPHYSFVYYSHAFLWQSGKMRDLGTLGGRYSWADAINEHGQIVGSAETARKDKTGDRIDHAFLWQNRKKRDLGPIVPDSPDLLINNRGQVVGQADRPAKDKYGEPIRHAVLWQNGKLRDLGTLGGAGSQAHDINDRGQIVGDADTAAKDDDGDYVQHAFVWENGKMTDLGSLGDISHADEINERGQIVGDAWTKTDERHAVLWTPQSAK
jgi:probable HAF family extracellular repeat protein